MKIQDNQHIQQIIPQEKTDKEVKIGNEVKTDASKSIEKEPAAVYEKSQAQDKSHVYDKVTIDQLKRDSEKAYSHLRQLVASLLERQGKTFESLDPNEIVEIDETARAEANELISENGPLGVEATSDRIVNFAKAISGGDKSKLDTLKKAIDQGFKEAEKILGKLPDISQKTYARIMEKLGEWEEE